MKGFGLPSVYIFCQADSSGIIPVVESTLSNGIGNAIYVSVILIIFKGTWHRDNLEFIIIVIFKCFSNYITIKVNWYLFQTSMSFCKTN